MSPGEAPSPEVRAARAAEAKAREERENNPALMAAYQEKKRKEEEARLEQGKREEEEKKIKDDYDKWRGSASKASTFQDSITESNQGWFWVFFGLGGRLEQRRYITASIFLVILFVASLHYVLSTYYDSTYFHIYNDPEGKFPWWLGFLWSWVVFGYPTYASTSKRLADLDVEPMFALGFLAIILIPFLGPILQVGMWIAMVAMPGTEGDNNFGPETRISVDARNARQ